jgi:hypothetical protein
MAQDNARLAQELELRTTVANRMTPEQRTAAVGEALENMRAFPEFSRYIEFNDDISAFTLKTDIPEGDREIIMGEIEDYIDTTYGRGARQAPRTDDQPAPGWNARDWLDENLYESLYGPRVGGR